MSGIAAFATAGWLDTLGRSVAQSFFMFWETLWPLVVGFTVSGAVQAFASREAMQATMGTLDPGSVVRASAYGMASSSCSYAAAATAKSLFAKGADLVSAVVFMFASTNLVVELGVVLAVLIGWQFVVGEFVGGVVMIALLALLGGFWLRGQRVDEARERLVEASGLDHDAPQGPVPPEGSRREVWAARFGSKGGWADAAGYAIADLKMLRKELLLGYGAAGVLAVAVPAHLWSIVFLQGHGWVTSLQNVVVAPLVAVVSCVCSVGNVPLAAALWKGGISFGGVVSFIFADLVSLPLLLVYRRYYGARLALRMLGLFWLVMSAAGLVTEVIFRAAGLVPVSRRYVVAPNRVAWGPTTYLDIASLVLLGVLYWTYCHRDRFGGGVRTALDPVCGMQVARASAPAWLDYEGERVYFCSEHCRHRFEMDPAAADKVERQRSRDRRPI